MYQVNNSVDNRDVLAHEKKSFLKKWDTISGIFAI